MQEDQKATKIGYLLWLGAVAPAFLIVGLSVFIFAQFSNVIENRFWVNHTQEVLLAAGNIEKLHGDLGSRHRGFVITGKKAFLDAYEETKVELFDGIDRLKNMVDDNPPQVARLENVEARIKVWLKTAGEPEIEVRRHYDRGEIPFSEVSKVFYARHRSAANRYHTCSCQ